MSKKFFLCGIAVAVVVSTLAVLGVGEERKTAKTEVDHQVSEPPKHPMLTVPSIAEKGEFATRRDGRSEWILKRPSDEALVSEDLGRSVFGRSMAMQADTDTVVVFFDDFDGGGIPVTNPVWTTEDVVGDFDVWHQTDFEAYQGGVSWWCGDTLTDLDPSQPAGFTGYLDHWYQVLQNEVALDFTGYATITLTYMHRYLGEPPEPYEEYDGWDGHNLRISFDGGTTFQVIPDSLCTPAYTCTSLFAFGEHHCEGHPIPGWAQSDTLWLADTIDLSGYRDSANVIIRWAFASDPCWCTGNSGPDCPGGNNEWAHGLFLDEMVITADGSPIWENNCSLPDDPLIHLDNRPGYQLWTKIDTLNHTPGGDSSWTADDDQVAANTALVTPVISLPDVGYQILLGYWCWPDIPDADGDSNNLLEDYWRIDISTDSGMTWEELNPDSYDFVGGDSLQDTIPQWTYRENAGPRGGRMPLDLSGHAGEDIMLRWRLTTDCDDNGGNGEGLFIDDVWIYYRVPVLAYDILVWNLIGPGRLIYPNTDASIQALAKNLGQSTAVNVPIVCELDTVTYIDPYWADTQYVTLASGAETTLTFYPCSLMVDVRKGFLVEVFKDPSFTEDTVTWNDTCYVYDWTSRLSSYDDGSSEYYYRYTDGWVLGLDYFCPTQNCTLIGVQIMMHDTLQDGIECGIEAWKICDNETTLIWDTLGLNPPRHMEYEVEIDPPIPWDCNCRIMVGVIQPDNSDDFVLADGDSLYWWPQYPTTLRKYWSRTWQRYYPTGDWEFDPAYANFIIRPHWACEESRPSLDARVANIYPPGPSVYPGCGIEDIQATIQNPGSTPVAVPGVCTVFSATQGVVLDTTFTTSVLQSLEYETVSLGPWTPDTNLMDEQYTIKVRTNLAGDERPWNNEFERITYAQREQFWDDGVPDGGQRWTDAGSRFGMDFECCYGCSVDQVKWMTWPTAPGGGRQEQVALEIFKIAGGVPESEPIWAETTSSAAPDSQWNVINIDPPVAAAPHFLLSYLQLSDEAEAKYLALDRYGGPWWRHEWQKYQDDTLWEGPGTDNRHNYMLRPVLLGTPTVGEQFIRGDVDGSGQLTLGDGIRCFRCQFVPGWPDSCRCDDAMDANDNGAISIGDCLRILRKQFVPGWQDSIPPPCCSAPGDCGPDPTEDALGCEEHPGCGTGKSEIVPKQEIIGGELIPGKTTIIDGELILPVYLSATRDLSGFAYTISYDPSVLSFVSLETKSLVTEHFDFVSALPADGQVKVGAVVSFDFTSVLAKGNHHVADLVFEVEQLDHDILLKFTDAELVDTKSKSLTATLSDVVVTDLKRPTIFGLSQNYPNPTKTTGTVIRYQLPKSTHTILRIYNLAGQVVKTLVNRFDAPGYYSVHWDGRDDLGRRVSSGVYFYRLDANGFTCTHKLVMIE